MSDTTKTMEINDSAQALGSAFNRVDNSLTTGSFLVGKVSRKVARADTDSGDLGGAAAGDDFSYSENGNLLYTIRVLYSDIDKSILLSAERVE